MITPHGGGKRLEKDSDDYRAILAWVQSGAAYGVAGSATEPKLARLEVYPPVATLPLEGQRRLLVTARFSDGHTEDFTHQVLYASNNADVATVNADGVVSGKRLGETAALIRGDWQALLLLPRMLGKRREMERIRKLSPRQVRELILGNTISLRELSAQSTADGKNA